jgi:hypothetical protein
MQVKHLRFRFKLSWVNNPDFIQKVAEIWNKPCHAEPAFYRIQNKLKKFKKYFKGWGFNRQGEKQEMQEELWELEHMEEDNILNAAQYMRKSDLQCESMRLLEEEELYWYKRSHEQWLLKGDNNTEFFHRIANGRKRKNTIFSSQEEDGLVEGDENLVSLATKYYKELFGPSTCYNIPLNPDLWGVEEKYLSIKMIHCVPFSESEVKYALFQKKHNKAAGPVEFYQACWDIIKSDIMELFNGLYMGKLDVSRISYGVITLLPKVVDADKIRQFRPICLLNCLYK